MKTFTLAVVIPAIRLRLPLAVSSMYDPLYVRLDSAPLGAGLRTSVARHNPERLPSRRARRYSLARLTALGQYRASWRHRTAPGSHFARWTIALRIVALEGSLTRVRSGVSGMVPTDDYVQSLPRKRMAAGALFVDSASRILLVDPVYRDTWDLPGGAVEAEESPYAACRREVAEGLGLDRPPGRVLAVDWGAVAAATPRGPRCGVRRRDAYDRRNRCDHAARR